ncbi:hypothetical protein R1sor_024477 [Riccia sorocarpa]|uniref:Uncharacterized protein n=1 Tax=Riccia sorocarpa TaxID=122646 RepID=A0ABD3GUP5_9MARC
MWGKYCFVLLLWLLGTALVRSFSQDLEDQGQWHSYSKPLSCKGTIPAHRPEIGARKREFDIFTSRVAGIEGAMESSPKPSPLISDVIEGGKRNFARRFELSSKKLNQLRDNVARNVRTLTGKSDQPSQIMAESSKSSLSVEVRGSTNSATGMLMTWSPGDAGDGQAQETSSAHSISSTSLGSLRPATDEGIPSPHYDLSARIAATSTFDIGSIGTPVMDPKSSEVGKVERLESSWKPELQVQDPPSLSLSSRPENTLPPYIQQQPPLVDLNDVRRFVGNSIIIWRKIRALGLPKTSWENKMPWRQPRTSYLAKGLKCPPEEFSSEKEKHAYYRRARQRGRYLIGPIPIWSFIVADLALLYFLIDNPAGKFLL